MGGSHCCWTFDHILPSNAQTEADLGTALTQQLIQGVKTLTYWLLHSSQPRGQMSEQLQRYGRQQTSFEHCIRNIST
jgi:hypothetical protein